MSLSCPACLQRRTAAALRSHHYGAITRRKDRRHQSTAAASSSSSEENKEDTPIASSSSSSHGRSTSSKNGSTSQLSSLALAKLQTLRHQAMTTFNKKQSNILTRLGEASGKINQATGYADIDRLKLAVKMKEEELKLAREQAKEAKERHAQAMEERAASGREVNDLLSRKSNWLASDVTRFTELVSLDHINEAKERETRLDSVRAEESVEKGLSDLMRTILDRYHEEQVWSDKIRSLSTYGSLGITALNILIFLLALMLVEPYKRRRMVREVEGRIKERDEQNKDALREDLEDLRFLLLKNGGNLASWNQQEQPTPSISQQEAIPAPVPALLQDDQAEQAPIAVGQGAQVEALPTNTEEPTSCQPAYAERDLWYIGAAGSIMGGVVVSLWQVLFR